MHLSALDLNLLVVLHALLETQSVKLAAGRLGLSPSATSHALGRVRDALGDPILVRAGKTLVPTPRGERLRPQLARVLEDVESLFVDTTEIDPAVLRRSFRVATTDYGERVVLEPLGNNLHHCAPGVDLYAFRSTRLETDIRDGSCDLAVGVINGAPPDVEVEDLFAERFVCLLRKDHPAAKRRLTLRRYAALDHILVAPGGTARGVADRVLAEHDLHRRVARTVASFVVAPRLVCNSDYVLTLAERMARPLAAELDLVVRDAPDPIGGFTVRMAWHRRTDADPAHHWLRNQVRAAVEPTAG